MFSQSPRTGCLIASFVLFNAGFLAAHDVGSIPNDGSKVHPVLIGASLPAIEVQDPSGQAVSLNDLVAKKPTVLIVYRGGWCPFCTRHLGDLQTVESKLIDLGYQLLAVSPDRPEKVAAAAKGNTFTYQLLSDSTMKVAKALGIAFQVEDSKVKLYKSKYGIDMEADSGQTHHLLPVPSVFIIGTDGVIQFTYINPDYKVRLNGDVLLAAGRAVLQQN
ncbi:peroxiredoxin-like family protein [Planctomycetota bacterium]